MKNKIIASLVVVVTLFLILITIVVVNFGPVSNNTEPKEFVVESGSTYFSIAPKLKEQNLIKSEFFYKLYIRITNPKPLQACTHNLSEANNLNKLVSILEQDCLFNSENVRITIPENFTLERLADRIAANTNNTRDDLFEVWDNKEFINEMIDKYWFLTDVILDNRIIHPLEGYFFPSTYDFSNADVTPREIAISLLDQMDVVLTRNKDLIDKSDYTIHEVMTFANIVEYEGITKDERHMVAGVFQNRLDRGWKLESCATLAYALGYSKPIYSGSDLTVDSPYNSYNVYHLPIGPGGLFSEESLIAALNPTNHDYMFFLSAIYDDNKTYYSKTLGEHEAKRKIHLEGRS